MDKEVCLSDHRRGGSGGGEPWVEIREEEEEEEEEETMIGVSSLSLSLSTLMTTTSFPH